MKWNDDAGGEGKVGRVLRIVATTTMDHRTHRSKRIFNENLFELRLSA